jgi:hypothetical protein
MLTDETYENARQLIDDLLDGLEELDESVEGFVDLLEFTLGEIQDALACARCDLGDDYDD